MSVITANPSWLVVPSEDELPYEVEDEVGPVAKKIGFTPNVVRDVFCSHTCHDKFLAERKSEPGTAVDQ